MKKLKDCVKFVADTESCVLLKVKRNKSLDLILLGCFNGNEKMFHLTKGPQHVCTVWYGEDNNYYSWDWGDKGYTLASDSMMKRGREIQSCIEDDFGIKME